MAVNPCAPNASRPKTGVALVTSLGAVAISDFLLRGRAAWAFDLAVALGVVSFDTVPFCAGPPPDLPNIPPERYLGYFNPLNPQGAAQLAADMFAIVGHYFWYASCECVAGPQPPDPPAMPPPAGVQRDPPALGQPVGIACTGWGQWAIQDAFDSTGTVRDITHPASVPTAPVKWAQIHFTASTISGPPAYPITWTWQWTGAGGTPIGTTFTYVQTGPHIFQENLLLSTKIAPGFAELHAVAHTDVPGATGIGIQHQYGGYCSDPGSALDEPCCPPDPLLVQLLVQIKGELDELLSRGTGATGYARGTAHSGLRGTGSLSVSRVAGILVEVSSGVPTNPVLGGNPPYMWDLGFITMLTADGMILERRLTRSAQLWLDASWALATQVGYFLNPGVAVTITELVSAALP